MNETTLSCDCNHDLTRYIGGLTSCILTVDVLSAHPELDRNSRESQLQADAHGRLDHGRGYNSKSIDTSLHPRQPDNNAASKNPVPRELSAIRGDVRRATLLTVGLVSSLIHQQLPYCAHRAPGATACWAGLGFRYMGSKIPFRPSSRFLDQAVSESCSTVAPEPDP